MDWVALIGAVAAGAALLLPWVLKLRDQARTAYVAAYEESTKQFKDRVAALEGRNETLEEENAECRERTTWLRACVDVQRQITERQHKSLNAAGIKQEDLLAMPEYHPSVRDPEAFKARQGAAVKKNADDIVAKVDQTEGDCP